jgi:hypothetical protein
MFSGRGRRNEVCGIALELENVKWDLERWSHSTVADGGREAGAD